MTISDASFEHIYNKKLLRKLDQKFGAFTRKHIDLSITSQSMLNLTEKMKVKRRRGEVVMVIPNKKGEIWLHTKAFYPPGVYRL
ncbi:MAG: hypothetical protein R3264_21255, partial [Anaerolineae bacterium]|nr:hypothetical protein [Anaerolineae bacterium]